MNKNQVEVSLILCGYNAEAAMEKSLDSAVAQTLEALEILCINDGSTDRTSEIFHSYTEKDSRIKVIDHPVKKGLLAARQTGVDNASGKYIMFLDPDDALVPEACLELAQKMEEAKCDIIHFDAGLVFASEEERQAQEKAVSEYFSLKRDEMLCGSDNILKSCFQDHEFTWNVWSKIYRIELMRKVYSFVPEKMNVEMSEDPFAFFLAASMAEKLAFANKKYYLHSVGAGESAFNNLKHEERYLDVYYKFIKPYADKHSSAIGLQVADKLGIHLRNCLSRSLLNPNSKETYKDIIEREIRNFGPDETARIFAENWHLFGMHPLKTVFLGIGSETLFNRTETIRKIGVITTGSTISPSMSRLIELLNRSQYEIQIFVKNDPSQSVENPFPGCQFEVYPDDRENMTSYFRRPDVQKQNDAFILIYDSCPDYDLTGFLLFLFRFAGKKTVCAFLEKEIGQLNCHDKIYLGAFDCVLKDSSDITPLFGKLGVLSPERKSGQLESIFAAFNSNLRKDHRKTSSARKSMQETAADALAALGIVGFGTVPAVNRETLEQKIAAAGSSILVEDYCLIREAGFFDDEYYRKQFPGCSIEDPILHFCSTGFLKLAAPSAIFDSKYYYLANPDLFPNVNPLVHYLRYGIYEHRNICFPAYELIRNSGYFDEDYYRSEHKEELGTFDPLSHYLLIGWKKGYLPSERFVDRYYSGFYFDMVGSSINPLVHYVCWGKKEGRCSFPLHPRFEQYFPEGYDTEAFWQRKEKYLIVVHQLDFTGVPILSKMIAEIFCKEKSAAIISPMDGPLRETCLKAGIPVLVDSDFYVHRERVPFYKEKGFGVCLFNTLAVVSPFLIVADTIPSILWIHDNIPKRNLPVSIQRRIECAPTVFATSKTTRKVVSEYNPGVRYLPYPIKDFGGHHKTAVPDKIRFGVFGTYIDRKGQDLAIAAFKKLPAELKAKAELLLIGNSVLPEYAKKLDSMVLGEEHIHFVPAQKDAAAYHQFYENLEVQICPSRTDPMPLVVFDGMMHGCPEILSDTVGQSEFIRNGENGYVFQSGNVEALRDCMVRILEAPERFIDMSRAIRQTFLNNAEFTKASGIIRRVLDEVKNYL